MKGFTKFFVLVMVSTLFVSGCATNRAKKKTMTEQESQVSQLQTQLQAKDQEIADLQSQLDSSQRALSNQSTTTNYIPSDSYSSYSTSPGVSYSTASAGKSSWIRVAGVSVTDVQRALLRAGYDPGPVDGKFGSKTKSAIKAFQSSRRLKADGIVGARTWAALS